MKYSFQYMDNNFNMIAKYIADRQGFYVKVDGALAPYKTSFA